MQDIVTDLVQIRWS